MRPVITPAEASTRLALIFPRTAFDPALSSPIAGKAVSAMIYVGAVVDPSAPGEDATWSRPADVLWMIPEVLERDSSEERRAWHREALSGRRRLDRLLTTWGIPTRQDSADNSRENLRDDTFRSWREHGVLAMRPGIRTTSSAPRWALDTAFADLFDPALTGDALEEAIETWRAAHMSTSAKLKAAVARLEQSSSHAVAVTLPSSQGTRTLEPGIASLILQGVIEQWAPARLAKPFVLTISEPGDKLFVGEANLLAFLQIHINVSELLPDALIADVVDPVAFWIVEAVHTDGPITDQRKADLLEWAVKQGIPAEACRFLTAFRSRNDIAARRRLKDLAADSFAWYLDEPTRELSWHEINPDEA